MKKLKIKKIKNDNSGFNRYELLCPKCKTECGIHDISEFSIAYGYRFFCDNDKCDWEINIKDKW